MKRALLGTLSIGAIAAGLAIALQISGLLARPAAALGKAVGLSPNEAVGFGNFLFLILLSFAVAWTMLQVTGIARQAGLFVLLILELLGAAWVLRAAHVSFPPLPAILAATGATFLALGLNATRTSRQRRATARAFAGRLAQAGIDRLAESEPLNLFEPSAREASFVYCEIANEAELIEDLPPAACAQLTREFIDCARKRFLQDGGYLQAADGEGIRVLFGFPNSSSRARLRGSSRRPRFSGGVSRRRRRSTGFVRQSRSPHRDQFRDGSRGHAGGVWTPRDCDRGRAV